MIDVSVQLHADSAKLVEEVRLLRNQLARQLQELDDLRLTVIPNLESRYYMCIGREQFELLAVEVQVRRLKRKIEMIQMAFNRCEPVSVEAVDRQLDKELADWNRQVDELARKLEAAKVVASAERLTVEDQKELRRLYYELAKKAHPDLNPDQSERLTQIWLQISTAYQNGSLDGLRALALLLEDDADDTGLSPESLLTDRRDSLKHQLESVSAATAALLEAFPCSLMDCLEDDEWVHSQQANIKERYAACEQQRDQLGLILAGIISGLVYDEQPCSH